MARPLSPVEKKQARQIFPRLNVDAVVVTDEKTQAYNCLAWTFGMTNAWVWPWGSHNATKAEFDALYRSRCFRATSSGEVAAFGVNLGSMTHGTISGPGHGPRWESKCGAWLRIQHGLAELEGGSAYGNVQGFYTAKPGLTELQSLHERLRTMGETLTLSRDEIRVLQDKVQDVDSVIREAFDSAYRAWKESWNHPLIVVSSNPNDRTKTTEFLELISLGPAILPLLFEKLKDPDEFFALQAVDRLIRPELVIEKEIEDESIFLGEQARAIETMKRWIAFQR